MGKFVLQTGYQCNNNCLHCVMKQEIAEAKRNIIVSYSSLINFLNSPECKASTEISVTGGEVTLRKDFPRIINYIKNQYPDKKICIQTNGRNLSKYIDILCENKNQISLTISFYSLIEEKHNFIANSLRGNPYQETMKSIKLLVEKNFEDMVLEFVITNYNKDIIFETCKYFYDLGVNKFSFSYPHMPRYNNEPDFYDNMLYSVTELSELLEKIYDYFSDKKTIFYLEAIPICVYAKNEKEYSKKKDFFRHLDANRTVVMSLINQGVHSSSQNIFYKKNIGCNSCCFNNICTGTWTTAFEKYNKQHLIPILKEE